MKALSRYRFIRFGTVGLSGTLVNLAVLHICQAHVLTGVFPADRRLRISLGIAIVLATMNNYLWNRWWTWGDRKRGETSGFLVQMAQYYMACAIAIFLQYLITLILARLIHYLIANIISIVLSAVFVYLLNDVWTFRLRNK